MDAYVFLLLRLAHRDFRQNLDRTSEYGRTDGKPQFVEVCEDAFWSPLAIGSRIFIKFSHFAVRLRRKRPAIRSTMEINSSYYCESRQSGRNLHLHLHLHLHVDGTGLYALECYRGNPLNHAVLCPALTVTNCSPGCKNVKGTNVRLPPLVTS